MDADEMAKQPEVEILTESSVHFLRTTNYQTQSVCL